MRWRAGRRRPAGCRPAASRDRVACRTGRSGRPASPSPPPRRRLSRPARATPGPCPARPPAPRRRPGPTAPARPPRRVPAREPAHRAFRPTSRPAWRPRAQPRGPGQRMPKRHRPASARRPPVRPPPASPTLPTLPAPSAPSAPPVPPVPPSRPTCPVGPAGCPGVRPGEGTYAGGCRPSGGGRCGPRHVRPPRRSPRGSGSMPSFGSTSCSRGHRNKRRQVSGPG